MAETTLDVATKASEDSPAVVLAMPVVLDDVQGIIARALEVARASGRDYGAQCQSAAEAIVAVRHDLTFSDALNAVYRFRERDAA